jgi:putative tryptophan/tyrosine transport system substrate-binding protein
MDRRSFAVVLALVWPVAAYAQRQKPYRVGFLAGGARPSNLEPSLYGGFLRGMRELGYVEGKDYVVEWRFADGNYDRFPQLAAELVKLGVEVIVLGAMAAARPTQQVTSTTPIVMGFSVDPVANGLIQSLARPGGNSPGCRAIMKKWCLRH